MSTLVMVVGLNPVRLLRAAGALHAERILALTTPETEHLAVEAEDAALELGLTCSLSAIRGDAYSFAATVAALRVEVPRFSGTPTLTVSDPSTTQGSEPGPVDWVIAGGTKPMIAAQVVTAAEVAGSRLWYLDDRRSLLLGASGERLAVEEPHANLSPVAWARMHAGLDAVPDVDRPQADDPVERLELVRWLHERLRRPSHVLPGESAEDVGLHAEDAVIALIRSVLPPNYDAHGSLTVPLRDPLQPTQPAMETLGARTRPRTFEVDGMVVRGTRAWVIESKFRNLKLEAARVAAAELDVRRRHLAGDGATGVLVMLDDSVGKRFAREVPTFELAGIQVITRGALIDAAEAVLSDGQLAETELADVFGAAWGLR